MLKINIGSNLIATAYQLILQFSLLPIILGALGSEAYGLVGIFTVLLTVFSLLDLGMSPALGRELSRLSADSNSAEKMRLTVSTLEIVCGVLAVLIGLTLLFSADSLSKYWVTKTTLSPAIVLSCISWMGIQIALQFMTSFYNSGLMGLQKIVLLNLLQSGIQTIRAIAVAGLLLFMPAYFKNALVEQFFILNALISGFGLAVLSICLYKCLPDPQSSVSQQNVFIRIGNRFNLECLQSCWRYAAGMTATMTVVMFLTQLDKIILSKVLSLEQFGFYTVAASVAMAITKPAPLIFSAVLPKFTQLVAANDTKHLELIYIKSIRLVAWVTLPLAGAVILLSEPFFHLYLGRDGNNIKLIASLTSILIMGNALHSLTYMPYALSLAYGWTRYGFNISFVACIFLVPIILFGAINYGATGAACSWLVLNIGYLLFSIRYLHKKILPTMYVQFYKCLTPPLAIFLVLITIYFSNR